MYGYWCWCCWLLKDSGSACRIPIVRYKPDPEPWETEKRLRREVDINAQKFRDIRHNAKFCTFPQLGT